MIRATLFIPVILIAALVAVFLIARPFDYLSKGAPPGELLMVERVRLDDNGIHATIRASSAQAIVIAQVQVDGAYRSFSMAPDRPIGFLGIATIDIPYPWLPGETHHLSLITSTGATFEHNIEIAVSTLSKGFGDFMGLALIGLFVGIVPIVIGYAFYPALVSFGETGREFAISLTIGLLAFLLLDTISEGLEFAEQSAEGLRADLIVWLSALLSALVLLAVGRRDGRPPEGTALALFISIGIGVHNLGEGLAIGASFSTGEVALASFLILGFALHNVTEGIAISAPIRKEDISLIALFWFAVIAGGPAIAGTMIGTYSFSPFLTALAFGVGAGAIIQVIIEIGGIIVRRSNASSPWHSTASILGFITGVSIMYATAFIIHV